MEGSISLALKHSTLSEKLTVQTSLFTFKKVANVDSNYLLNDVLISQWKKKSPSASAAMHTRLEAVQVLKSSVELWALILVCVCMCDCS